jgi:hypothetical protein
MHDSVELIIHNAWRLNFNLGLSSFKVRYHINYAYSRNPNSLTDM